MVLRQRLGSLELSLLRPPGGKISYCRRRSQALFLCVPLSLPDLRELRKLRGYLQVIDCKLDELVDLIGIEPMTSSMPWKRAPSCATGPL